MRFHLHWRKQSGDTVTEWAHPAPSGAEDATHVDIEPMEEAAEEQKPVAKPEPLPMPKAPQL
jgi:hypothetical protein